LTEVDPLFADEPAPIATRREAVQEMLPYIAEQVADGQPLHRITRHMLGLYHGQPGGRIWRQVLSTEAGRHGAGIDVLEKAMALVEEQAARVLEAA
jgi:tRNA-dihydrouridine synthase A